MSEAVVNTIVGGIIGIVGTGLGSFGSYWGPRKLEEWREARTETRMHGPRKRLLKTLLEDARFADGRTLDTLVRVTGTTPEECRRLLIEIGARGLALKGDVEGWALLSRKPIEEQ